MKAITLRKIPPEMARAIQIKARQSKTSISRAIINIIKDALGMSDYKKAPIVYHDLDNFSGKWSKEEAVNFERALNKQRMIDQDLWA